MQSIKHHQSSFYHATQKLKRQLGAVARDRHASVRRTRDAALQQARHPESCIKYEKLRDE